MSRNHSSVSQPLFSCPLTTMNRASVVSAAPAICGWKSTTRCGIRYPAPSALSSCRERTSTSSQLLRPGQSTTTSPLEQPCPRIQTTDIASQRLAILARFMNKDWSFHARLAVTSTAQSARSIGTKTRRARNTKLATRHKGNKKQTRRHKSKSSQKSVPTAKQKSKKVMDVTT